MDGDDMGSDVTADQLQHVYDLAWRPVSRTTTRGPKIAHWPHCEEGESPFCTCDAGPMFVAGELLTGGATDGPGDGA